MNNLVAQVGQHDLRPLAVAMLDVIDTADRVHVDAKTRTAIGEDAAAELRLVESPERVMKLGKTMVELGLLNKIVEQRERDVALEARYVVSAVSGVLDALPEQLPIAPGDAEKRAAWRSWAYTTALSGIVPNVEAPPRPALAPAREARVVDAEVVNATSSADPRSGSPRTHPHHVLCAGVAVLILCPFCIVCSVADSTGAPASSMRKIN